MVVTLGWQREGRGMLLVASEDGRVESVRESGFGGGRGRGSGPCGGWHLRLLDLRRARGLLRCLVRCQSVGSQDRLT